MAGEVDRLRVWMDRVERWGERLEKSPPEEQKWIRAALEVASQAQQAAFLALTTAAQRGDPEALVALEALESQLEEKTWVTPRPAA